MTHARQLHRRSAVPPQASARAAGLADLAFHHFGLAVSDPEEAFRYLDALGYVVGSATFDPLQRVHVAMRHHPAMPDVEVIWPGEAPSPIDALIQRAGTMIYHICYTCARPEAVVASLEAAGVGTVTVSPPTPAVLFDGSDISFHLVSGFGLIELLRAEP